MKRWFQYQPDDGPYGRNAERVWLVCPCGKKTLSLRTLVAHHGDYHQPGLLSARMILDLTQEWRDEWVRRKYPAIHYVTYSDLKRHNDYLETTASLSMKPWHGIQGITE